MVSEEGYKRQRNIGGAGEECTGNCRNERDRLKTFVNWPKKEINPLELECTGNYRNERDRLKTFVNWPTKEINPLELAKHGFFYTQLGDEIQCAFCGLQISNWCPECDPNSQHKIYSNHCDFLRKRDCGNIPI